MIKVHGFGMSARWAWERYPFYSVDSTGWQGSIRFGGNSFEKNKKQVLYDLKKKHYMYRADLMIKNYKKLGEDVTRLWEKRGIKWE